MVHYYSSENIRRKVKAAIGVLLQKDSFLLDRRVNERSISHKLGEYLQAEFKEWNVDCEYNRISIDVKKIEGIRECDEHRKTDRVLPDIIIHLRNTNTNILVVELNKENLNPECDIMKLKLFTDTKGDYRYSLGLFIQFDGTSYPQLTWFKNGNTLGS